MFSAPPMLYSEVFSAEIPHPDKKLTIIGAGIVAALEVYFAHQAALAAGESLRTTMFEKNSSLSETTASNIAPSLTPDEILSVVPRGHALLEKLGIVFSQPGGIRVDDVPGVNDSETAQRFIEQVQRDSVDEVAYQERTETLLRLGKESMELWQKIYDEGDEALRTIMEDANFNPCREPTQEISVLHDGYRIDLMYGIPNALSKAEGMKADYEKLGYRHCKILSPDEVAALDPSLKNFCLRYSQELMGDAPAWQDDVVALYRPGGCLNTEVFLPKFYEYLRKKMGQYTSDSGLQKDCLQLRFNRRVDELLYADFANNNACTIVGLRYNYELLKVNKHAYGKSDYVFCSGEAVGTLEKLGLEEPAYTGFAGASLKLRIPVPADRLEEYQSFNHCMEVHKEGIVLAWQARLMQDAVDNNHYIAIGVAGTKAFYDVQSPNKNEAFARDRNLLQLNMMNDVLPEPISWALGSAAKGQDLTADDLQFLENKGIAKRWVGIRAVAYDGFPTLGCVFNQETGHPVENARTTTHLGSGGVSFAPAAVLFSRAAKRKRDGDAERVPGSVGSATVASNDAIDPLVAAVTKYGNSQR